jgi:hypothetical protein
MVYTVVGCFLSVVATQYYAHNVTILLCQIFYLLISVHTLLKEQRSERISDDVCVAINMLIELALSLLEMVFFCA